MWSLFKARERFSLDELKHLNDQLHKYPVINNTNKDVVVETLRSIAELMIWGDQHDQQFFEYFMDSRVLAHFIRILKSDESTSGGVPVQLLQTLNIMIQNLRNKTAIYYMFSKEYINNIITFPFDFKDEELLAYYISFLRIISVKLDSDTVTCFIAEDENGSKRFPLYTEAIKFFHHEEGMVRIAVRTLTLNVYNVPHDDVRSFVVSEGPVRYFEDLAVFVRQQAFKLDGLVNDASFSGVTSAVGRLDAGIAEVGDLLYYCNDVLSSGIPEVSEVLSNHLREVLVKDLLLKSLEAEQEPPSPSAKTVSPLTAMYMLSRLFYIITFKPLLKSMVADILRPSEGEGLGRATEKYSKSAPASEQKDTRNGTHAERSGSESGSGGRERSDSQRVEEGEAPSSVRRDAESVGLELAPSANSWERLLSHLLCTNERWVMASLSVLIAPLQNSAMDDALLDQLGVLPRRKRHKQLLLHALMSSKSDEELRELLSASSESTDESFELRHGVSMEDLEEFKRLHVDGGAEEGVPVLRQAAAGLNGELESMEPPCTCVAAGLGSQNGQRNFLRNGISKQKKCSCGSERNRELHAVLSRNRKQVLDSLVVLLCRRPPPCAEALWHAGWLLRQLLPHRQEHKLSPPRLKLLNGAYSAAREDLAAELVDCWCDLLPSVITEEWKTCRKALETPSLQKDSSYVLIPSSVTVAADGDTSSAALGERMRTSVKVFVALHQLRKLIQDGPVPEIPPLSQASPPPPQARTGRKGISLASVQEGVELPLMPGEAMACRVAFERGKERSVLLMVASNEGAGFLLLSEALPKQGQGVVRVVAPLAGSRPTNDKRHNKWLHLRIRSPQLPSADAGTLNSASLQGSRARTKRLADGRWTLAFPDDQKAKQAQLAVLEEICIQSNALRQMLEPLLGPIEPFKLEDQWGPALQ